MHSVSAMAGYLPDDATAAAFDDGWYRTGDVGWLEAEGWVHLTDRCKEMIKVSGFQVAPAEIESVLHGHPGRARLRRLRRRRRASRRGTGRRRPGRGRPRGPRRRPAGTGGGLACHLQDLRTVVARGHDPSDLRRARCCVGRCARNGIRTPRHHRREWTDVDVRLSPEQVALRDSAAQVVDRLGLHDGWPDLDDTERVASSTPRSWPRAGASRGRRVRRGRPLGVGGRSCGGGRGVGSWAGRRHRSSALPWRLTCDG